MTRSNPLHWPEGFPRTPPAKREAGKFRTNFAGTLKNVQTSLRAFGRDSGRRIDRPILSSNVDLLTDSPDDPGVAVWFVWDDMQVCIPVDRYRTPAANLQAIHHVIEARRTELRHGTLHLVRATFQGFRALPSPTAGESWRDVLGIRTPKPTVDEIRQAHREAVKRAHPDHGGTTAEFQRVQDALDRALAEARQ